MIKTEALTTIAIAPSELPTASAAGKPAKGATKQISFERFQSGKSIDEIAEERGLTRGTITGHLTGFIGKGVAAHQLMDATKLAAIQEALREHPEKSASAIRALLNNTVEYYEIRIAKASIVH